MSRDFDIEVPRQGDWFKELQLCDRDGAPIDLTGSSFAWSARRVAGTGAVIASAEVEITEAVNGRISVSWHGPDFDAIGNLTEVVRVAHDLKQTYPSGLIDVPLRGQLIIFPEVTA